MTARLPDGLAVKEMATRSLVAKVIRRGKQPRRVLQEAAHDRSTGSQSASLIQVKNSPL
jgi:hypothetical protein